MSKSISSYLPLVLAFHWALSGSSQSEAHGAVAPLRSVEADIKEMESPIEKLKETFGITYFSYLNGPGLHPDSFLFSPNQLGRPANDGINFLNQLSLRYKFSKNLALDFQSRFYLLVNNYTENPNFKIFRWEAPRIGISGQLLSGDDWTLTGAVNTDFPYFLPSPFTGFQARERTTVLTPGMFAAFKYKPKGSRWSLFSVVSPRLFIYADRDAAEAQMVSSGFSSGNKADIILAFQPTLNYQISEKSSISVGTGIDYRKQVVSDWNIFYASSVLNGESKAWRLAALPLNVGVTFNISPQINLFPFISAYPIASQRYDVKKEKQAGFLESASFGMWISGTVF
ncbi:MAG: hypothetical protein ABIQ95_10700 [Bdellovibrionia bacterium]